MTSFRSIPRKKYETLKKSDYKSILYIEDDEIESLEVKENEAENGSLLIFSAFNKRLFIWKQAKLLKLNTCNHLPTRTLALLMKGNYWK
jgi:hypothetical protein